MYIIGMNEGVCKGLYVVYTTIHKYKYFVGAYRYSDQARRVAKKYNGKYTLI